MEMAKVTSKGQITIPVSIRRRLNISEGDKLLFIDRPEGVMMVNPDMLPGGRAEELHRDARNTEDTRPKGTGSPGSGAGVAPAPAEAGPEADTMAAAAQSAPPAEPAPVQPEAETGRQGAPQTREDGPERQGAALQGLDLNSLLNEIRSIGSNI